MRQPQPVGLAGLNVDGGHQDAAAFKARLTGSAPEASNNPVAQAAVSLLTCGSDL